MNHVFRSLSVGTRQWAAVSKKSIFHRLPTACRPRQVQAFQLQGRRNFWSKWFGKKDKPVPVVDPSAPKFIYPELLCLYSAGSRTIWVGCMKLATTYPFLLTVFYVSPNIEREWPSLMQLPFVAEHPTLTGVIVCLLSLIPTGMFYLAAPYVTHIFVRIPPYARVSNKALMSWVSTVSPDTKLRIFTMMWLGRPKYVEVPLKELRFCKKRLGCVNMEWKWTQRDKPQVTNFYVERKRGPGKKGNDAFYDIMARIEEQTLSKESFKAALAKSTKSPPADATGPAAVATVSKLPPLHVGKSAPKAGKRAQFKK